VPNLPSLTKVEIMYLVQNKIARIEPGELDWCADTITSIELGGNRLRVSLEAFGRGTRVRGGGREGRDEGE